MTDKALEAALPGEAEVVAWVDAGTIDLPWEKKIVATNPEYVKRNGVLGQFQPLVTLASLQAMQARAEKAEREYEKVLNSYADENQRLSDAAEDAEARVKELEIERDTLLAAINQVGLTPGQKSWIEAFIKTRTALKGGSNG